MLKADRYYSMVKVKGCPKYGLIKKFKMDLIMLSRRKDPKINKSSILC